MKKKTKSGFMILLQQRSGLAFVNFCAARVLGTFDKLTNRFCQYFPSTEILGEV